MEETRSKSVAARRDRAFFCIVGTLLAMAVVVFQGDYSGYKAALAERSEATGVQALDELNVFDSDYKQPSLSGQWVDNPDRPGGKMWLTAPQIAEKARTSKLAMMDDISTINDIHAAYIHGSVPTAKNEADDIMALNFPDERNGSDSKTYQPSAYVRGTVVTFKAEAADITAKGTNHGVLAHKSVPVALKGPSVNQKLLQLHALSKARTSKLAMMDDISTINDIHAAYIHGSVPTAKNEADDIMALNFPDERSGSDSKTYQPSAYVRGSVVTFKAEAADITAKGTNHGVLAHKSVPVALKGPSVKQKLLQLHALTA